MPAADLEEFERNQLHHEDEEAPAAGPASEPEIRPPAPPPDAGAIKR
jgi:hypothetical protein